MINPLERFKKEKNLTLMEMATFFDVSESTIYQNLKGGRRELSEQIVLILDEMGYNKSQVKQEYKQYRQAKRAAKRKELMKSN